MIKVKKLHDDAKVTAHKGSAGLDIHCLEAVVLSPRGKTVVPTGLAIDPTGIVPKIMRNMGFVASVEVKSRSGTSAKHSIEKGAGLIDENYRDEIKIVLYNHSDDAFMFAPGERIAQLVFSVVKDPSNFEYVDELDSTKRTGGFGSTGK